MSCRSKPCFNGGTCKANGNTYTCSCRKHYEGIHCQRYVPCKSKPCWNGGFCKQDTDSYKCTCETPYYGSKCKDADSCRSHPCQHGSTCTKGEGTSFTCSCTASSNGEVCQRK
ncbi:hypothetical protein LSAT2_032709 [Lamellibrachia satsuma]|nr:hypothetical protein LSAT2_032709 [Lamellibrachia satsuma]